MRALKRWSKFFYRTTVDSFFKPMQTHDKNPYDVIGVDRSATQDEIRKRFKELARKYHPDISKEEDAKEKFQEINNAYQILCDEEKRAVYDSYGSTDNQFFSGEHDWNDTTFDASDLGSIFEDLFGFGGGNQFNPFGGFQETTFRGSNLLMMLDVTMEEMVYGATKTFRLPKGVECKPCSGTGEEEFTSETCPYCQGTGVQTFNQQGFMMQTTCQHCSGRGYFATPCAECDGNGYTMTEEEVAVDIPAGVTNGHQILLPGFGDLGLKGGAPGDLIVEVNVGKHPRFKRNNQTSKDIVTIKEINMIQAILGGSVKLKNVRGEAREITIPENSQYGDEIVVKGDGIQGGKLFDRSGNMIVKLKVVLPEFSLNRKQKQLLEKFLAEEEKIQRKNKEN